MKRPSVIFIIIASFTCMLCGCDLHLPGTEEGVTISVQRFDRLESRYLTTGDFSALQQMETDYPMETKTLIENVLHIGSVEDQDISSRFLTFFQDSALQTLIGDAEAAYANMDDINARLTTTFANLKREIPAIEIPRVYAQLSALDQSIIIGEGTIGISLDKYMGENYPMYKEYYRSDQRRGMSRDDIVPDCVCFYLLSVYPLANFDRRTQQELDLHTAKVMWVSNKMMGNDYFDSKFVGIIGKYMSSHKDMTVEQLLQMDDCSKLTE